MAEFRRKITDEDRELNRKLVGKLFPEGETEDVHVPSIVPVLVEVDNDPRIVRISLVRTTLVDESMLGQTKELLVVAGYDERSKCIGYVYFNTGVSGDFLSSSEAFTGILREIA